MTDLRGARFGVLSLHEGTTYFVQDLEKAIGFKRGDIVIDAVGGAPTRWKLLREGKIDAGLQPFPLSYESEAAGFSNLGPISKYVPDYEFTAVFLDPAWGDANRPAVTGFLRALRRGQAAMAADPDKAAAVLVKELGTTPDYARRAIGDALKFKLMPDGLAASEAGMRRVFTTLQRAGLVPNDQPFDMGPVRRSELPRGLPDSLTPFAILALRACPAVTQGGADMAYRCAILDDYQNVALKLADWSKVTKDVEIKVFTEAVRRSDADTIRDLQGLRHRRDDARAHALPARGDRRRCRSSSSSSPPAPTTPRST